MANHPNMVPLTLGDAFKLAAIVAICLSMIYAVDGLEDEEPGPPLTSSAMRTP